MMATSAAARLRFLAQVEAQGGRVVEEQWLGTAQRHRVICASSHETTARPSDVNRGTGICRTCSGTDPEVVWAAFQARITERGGTVLELAYLGGKQRHRIICAAGHRVALRPSEVVNRDVQCRICAGNDQETAWRLFCQLVEERGGQVLEPVPLGSNSPHRVICPEGHLTTAIPSYLRTRGGMCTICGPTSTIRAEQEFRSLVAAMGGTVTESAWRGASTPHAVACREGHATKPRPSDARISGSICRVCAGHDSEVCWREFRDRVAELGGRVLETAWLGNKEQHRVICGEGHATTVRPNNVDQGAGLCRFCKCKVWDIFYVVADDAAQTVKFGVTSHDPRARLRFHEVDGFTRVIRTVVSLPDAADLERVILAALKSAGVKPVRGREYYDLEVLATILDIADGWVSAVTAA